MPRLSKLLEKLEDRIANKWGRWYERNKARVPLYAVLGALGWYFYGMLLNSLKLGRESVFNTTGEEVESIWVLNPFRNLFVVLTPFGLGVTAVILLLICLITKKGYSWFSGYHFTRDPALIFFLMVLTVPPALQQKRSLPSTWNWEAPRMSQGCSLDASRSVPTIRRSIPPMSLTA